MTRALPAEAVALFREPPEGFVAARDALVRGLREDGRDDDAAAVKALRKPTTAVWALNQLAVRDPDGVRELLDAGTELRAAQQAALSSSRGAGRMREAAATRREVVARLTAAATEALSDAGHVPAAQEDRIRGALEAASVDPDVAARLRAGTLERVPTETPGFGNVFGLTAVAGEAGGDARPRRRRAQDGAGVAALRAEVATLRRDRDAATRAAERDRRALDRLARELDEVRERVLELDARHTEAGAAADASALEAKRAERALARAVERLERAGR